VNLRVRGEPRAVREVQSQLRDAQLRVTTGIDGLLESDGLPDRQERRRKRRLEWKRLVLAVAIVRAKLETRAEGPRVGLREDRWSRDQADQRDKSTHSRRL
jgi:hypothetical protein